MKITLTTLALIVKVSCLAATCRADSLQELANQAILGNRELQAARYNVDIAEARLKQAGSFPNPELQLSRSSDRMFQNSGEFQASAGLSQRFPLSGRLAKAEEVARVDISMAKAEIANQVRLLIGDVSRTARKLNLLDERLRSNERLQTSAKELIAVSERKLKVAEVSEADVNLEKLELEKLVFSAAILKSERAQANQELNRLLGRSASTANSVSDPLVTALDKAALIKQKISALERRPDLKLTRLAIERAQSEISLASAERWEDWSIGIQLNRDRKSYDSPLIASSRDDSVQVSLSIPLPLWNRNASKITEARANRTKSALDSEALESQIRTETEAAYSQLVALADLLDSARPSAQALAQSNIRLLKKSYTQGLVGIGAVIQAQQQLADTQQNFLSLIDTYLNALTNFELATACNSALENLS